MNKRLIQLATLILVVGVFYFLGKEVVQNWQAIRSYNFDFNTPLLLGATAIYSISFFILAVGWRQLLLFFKHPIPLKEALLFFFITQQAKYVPGKIWTAVARTKFCKPYCVAPSMTFLVTGLEAIFEVFAGTYISLLAILQSQGDGNFSFASMLIITGIGLVVLIPDVFYTLVNIYLRIVRHPPIERTQRGTFLNLLALQSIYLVAMLGIGLSQALFLYSFHLLDVAHFAFFVSIGALSYVASLLAFFTPSGLGVREGVWIFALRKFAAEHIGVIFAFVSRFWIIIIEGIFALVSLVILFILRRKGKELEAATGAVYQDSKQGSKNRQVAEHLLHAEE